MVFGSDYKAPWCCGKKMLLSYSYITANNIIRSFICTACKRKDEVVSQLEKGGKKECM